MVKLDKNQIKVSIINEEDNLGTLEFTKKNKFRNLDGARFSLTKLKSETVKDAKEKLKTNTYDYDLSYRRISAGNIGEFKFEQIPEGIYILEEIDAPAGYKKAKKYILEAKTETVDNKDKVVVRFTEENDPNIIENTDGSIDLINEPKDTEITIRKVRQENVTDTKAEHLGLNDAKFRLISLNTIDGDFYFKESFTNRTEPTTDPKDKVDNQQARGGGYLTFDKIKIGEYLLQELQAPKGYDLTKLYGWKLVVSEVKETNEATGKKKGDLEYKLYKVKKKTNINDTNLEEVKLDDIIKGDKKVKAFQIGNEARKKDIAFDKYLSDGTGSNNLLKPEYKELKDEDGNPISFNLYKADYYGAIVDNTPINKEPIVQNCFRDPDDIPEKYQGDEDKYKFVLEGMEFGGYYVLREMNPPEGYKESSDILLKIEAEAVASEGQMKVVVRDPNTNAYTNGHSMLLGVVNYKKEAKLGEFSIKKVGNAIGFKDGDGNPIRVGLRRAYFRLYTANEKYEIEYKDKDKKYPKEYIQKVTPGDPITHEEGGKQVGTNPKDLPDYQGIVKFDQLKPGHYVLEEYRGPAGYEKDPGKWYINVDESGTVTKYRDNPTTSTSPRTVDYSTQSLRYKTFGLDKYEPLQFNRLMSQTTGSNLEAFEYDASTEDLNVKVKASKVTRNDGQRTINLQISPKEKQVEEEQIIGNNIQLVFVFDRSKDIAAGAKTSSGTIDQNINKLISDIVEKAKKTNANIDATFIEYDNKGNAIKGGVNQDLLALDKSISTTQTYNMKTPSNMTGEDVVIKDYLNALKIKSRSTSNADGNKNLASNRDSYYNQIINTNKNYDKRLLIDISNFATASATKWDTSNISSRPEIKYYAAEIIWPFRNPNTSPHFDTWLVHVDQVKWDKNSDSNVAGYSGYMSNNSANDINGTPLPDHFNHILNTSNYNSNGVNTFKDYFDRQILTDANFIKERKTVAKPADNTINNASLEVILGYYINLLSSRAKIGNKELEKQASLVEKGTKKYIKLYGIDLKNGETLDFTYTINLINKAESKGSYTISNSTKFNNSNISMQYANGKTIDTERVNEDNPVGNGYAIIVNPTSGGSVTASKYSDIAKNETIILNATPDPGIKLESIKAFKDGGEEVVLNKYSTRSLIQTEAPSTYTFTMPESNVRVTANFTKIPQGDITLNTRFTYTNQKAGVDDSDNIPNNNKAGKIRLQVTKDGSEDWEYVGDEQIAPAKGNLTFNNLEAGKKYRFEYKKDSELAKAWGSEITTYIPIDISKPDDSKTVKMTISNGNLMEIFNHDETGFRIPLRISKVNENKGALTGSQFKARKLIDGDEANIYEKDSDGKYKLVGKGLPKYAKEPFDAVSEATGEPGDNYFRELSPGIYELEETIAPGTSYRLPTDKNGNPMKWYFKVFVNENKLPSEAGYMGITFDFDYTFTKDSNFNKNITKGEQDELIKLGKIEGLTRENPDFNKYVEEIKDDGRSNPARPDAPYKWIHDVQVTNYKNKTEFKFFKKDVESRQNLKGAEFSLEKVLVGNDGQIEFKDDGTPKTDPEVTIKNQTSDDKLGITFKNLDEGSYVLKETKVVNGYAPNDSFLIIKFKLADDGSWTQEVKAYKKDENDKYAEVTDEKEKAKIFDTNERGELLDINNNKNYIDLKFKKIEAKKVDGKEVEVPTSSFKLTKVDKNGKEIANAPKWKEEFHYGDSSFTFEKLGVGRYKLEETWAISKYEKPDPWYFNVVQDSQTSKLKIVFEKESDLSVRFTPIDNTTDGKKTPKLDNEGNPKDLRIVNFERTDFSFQKLKDELGKDDKKLPLKDALFNMKKVRDSMDANSRTYEYHENRVLKKYTNGNRITEYYDTGVVKTFTDKSTNKTYHYNENGELTKVNEAYPTEDDKKVQVDTVSSATGKYNELARSQSSGSVDFSQLGEGIYELEEIGIPEGYESEYNQFKWIFKVIRTDDGLKVVHDKDLEKDYLKTYEKDYYDKVYSKLPEARNIEESNDGKYSYKITNTKTVTDLKWKKIYDGDNTKIMDKMTKFTLYKKSDNPNQDIKTALKASSTELPYRIESTNGKFEITDLSKGIYVLNETQAPQGYKKMTRSIVIKIYEDKDANRTLKKQFYEAYEKDGDIELVSNSNDFENLLKGNPTTGEILTDKDGYFFVNNESKPYFFYISKGIFDDGKFTNITKGKLKLRIKADPEDTTNKDKNEYITTINLSDTKSYKIDVNGIELGKKYILEEIEAPDGYKINGKKYYLKFSYNEAWDQKFVATIVKIVGKDGKEIPTTDDNKTINKGYNINQGQPFNIVDEKTEAEFFKVGINETAPKGIQLKGVKFYLEKQDPRDIEKPNLGYYPITEKMEFIKSEIGKDGQKHYYIEEENGTKVYATGGLFPKDVTEENSRKEYISGDDGKFKITGLTDGFYRIIEPEAAKDGNDQYMKVNGPVKTFRVENGKVLVYSKDKDGKLVEKELTNENVESLGKIINEKEGNGEFTLEKVNEKGENLKGVTYTLHKTDETETQVGQELTTDENGKITFKNLPYGYYWLKETKTLDGYILDTKKKLIALGGGEWTTPDNKDKKDVSKSITFDGDQKELISTAATGNKYTVYPNKAEGMVANFKFTIDPNTTIKSGDYFTINFSDNVDLDGIFKTNDDKGKMPDSKLDIIGPAGKLAEAKINPDRKSITYTFTTYVDTYKPDFMSMYVQLFANRKEIPSKKDVIVTADIGEKTEPLNNNYHYSDSIEIDYRGRNEKIGYDGYQNPSSDISSYMLRLDPDNQTFTAIVYYNPWNKYLTNKNIVFTTDQDMIVNDLSVKTYRKSGWGSHRDQWYDKDLPDSYDVNFSSNDLTYMGNAYSYDRLYENNAYTGNTNRIYIPKSYLNTTRYETNTYVIEIKGKLAGNAAKSLKTNVHYYNHNVYYQANNGQYYHENTYTGNFETWSQFFNPKAIGDVSNDIKLLNFKNKIEFVKVDGGVKSNVVDKSLENPLTLKKLGIGETIAGAKFKLQKQVGNIWQDVDDSEKKSDQDGIFSWEGLAQGDYRVIETQTANPYLYNEPEKDKALSTFTVNKFGNIVDIKDQKQVLENYKKAEISIKKVDEKGKPLEGAKFYLAGEKNADGKTNKDPIYKDLTRPTGKDGIVTFDKLPAGKYTLTESSAPQGYNKSDKVWDIEISRDGRVKWTNSFDDINDQMKKVSVTSYKGGPDADKLKSEILGINPETKTFRQKITIKAKVNEIKNARLILDSVDPSLKLTQFNTKVRLVKSSDNKTIDNKDPYTTYKVETDNGTNPPHLTLTITPPHKAKEIYKPVGAGEGEEETDEEKYYQFIVDMPYKDEGRIGAIATYQVGTLNNETGKVDFGNDNKTVLDKYVEKENYAVGETNVEMKAYEKGYLDRDINLITTTYANIKQPDIYFKKVDAGEPDKALAGAEFEIQKKIKNKDSGKEEYRAIKRDGSVFTPSGTKPEEKWTSKSDEKGHFGFSDIPDGEYQIFETKAPDGYALVQNIVFKFVVKNGKIEYIVESDKNIPKNGLKFENESTKGRVNSKDNRILITNKKAQYPSTGGPGVWIGFTILGLVLMFIAVLTYWKRKDKLRV